MNRPPRFRRASGVRALAALLALAAPACSGEGGTGLDGGSDAPVSVVRLTPASAEVGVGSTLRLRLTALDAADNELPVRAAVWASQDTLVAAVSQDGMVTARRVGVVQLQAVVDGKSAYAVLSVVAARVAAVTVSPSTASVAAGATAQLSARATDAGGAALNDRFVFWQSSNDAVARVTSTGLVSGVAAGTATITATSEGQSGTAAVTVTGTAPTAPSTGPAAVDSVKVDPADTTMVRGTSTRFRVRVYSRGATVTGRAVTWSATGAVTVNASGDVTAGSQANTEGSVIATVEGKVGSARVRVTNKEVDRIAVSLDRASLPVGQTTTATATLRDDDGVVVSAASGGATWTSSDPSVATVTSIGDNTATVTAVRAGTATITAAADGVTGSTTVTVASTAPAPAPIASVEVTPAAPTVAVGATQQLTATPKDAAGNALSGRPAATWTSGNAAVATVSATGVVTAVGPGSATITATIAGVSGATAVTVPAPPPASIARVEVAPATATLASGATQQLTATPRDAAGNPLPNRPAATWTSSDPAVAAVNPTTGVVTVVNTGPAPVTATITATIEGVAGTATLTITPAPVASVAVTPATASVVAGGSVQLSATSRDAANRTLTGRTTTWTSSDTTVATVSTSGLVTARSPGAATARTVTITATVEGRTGTATVTVTPIPVARVEVTPSPATIRVGATQQFTATTYSANNLVLPGRTCRWTDTRTSGPPVISIGETTGLARGERTGTGTAVATCENVSGSASVTVTN